MNLTYVSHLRAVIVVGLLALATSAAGQTTPSPLLDGPRVSSELTADVILDRALARSAAHDDSELELEFDYILESIVDTLNGDGDVTDTETSATHRYPLERLLYDELVKIDGEPLDDKQRREEEKREWLPSSFEMQMNLRVFFRSTRRHIRQEWVEVRRLAPDDADH